MVRTQIQLTVEQAEKAKRLAAERGVSMAEVFRELIERAPEGDDRAERFARALAAVGTGRDIEGRTDVSLRHDEYLAEIFAEDLHKS
jgi:hypothetical protein